MISLFAVVRIWLRFAMCAFEEEQMQEVYRTTQLMKKELSVPFQHVCMVSTGRFIA